MIPYYKPYRKPSAKAKREFAYAKSRIPKWPRQNLRQSGYVGQELRFADTSRENITLPSTLATAVVDNTTTNCLNAIAQGTGENQRSGLRVVNKSIQIKVNWDMLGGGDQVLRLLVVQDRQTNGAQLTGSDVLADQVPGTANDNLAMVNLENKHRFKILYDKIFQTEIQMRYWNGSAEISGNRVKSINIFIPLGKRGVTTRYLGTTNAVSDIADNSFHLLAITNETSTDTVTFNSRVRYFGN